MDELHGTGGSTPDNHVVGDQTGAASGLAAPEGQPWQHACAGSAEVVRAGTGQGLGSQGSLAFDARLQRFFAVNTGSNSISMLSLDADGNLQSLSTVDAGGLRPISITARAF